MPQFLQGVVGRSRVSSYVGPVKVAGWLVLVEKGGGYLGTSLFGPTEWVRSMGQAGP